MWSDYLLIFDKWVELLENLLEAYFYGAREVFFALF